MSEEKKIENAMEHTESDEKLPSDENLTTPKQQMPSNTAMLAFAVVCGIVIIMGAIWYSGGTLGNKRAGVDSFSSLAAQAPIARVNGVEITKAEFDQQMKQTEAMLASMGGDGRLQDSAFITELRDSLIQDLINAELLYQAAIANNNSVSEEEIETEYRNTETQIGGAESLANQLALVGLDEARLRILITRQMAIERHLEQKLSLSTIAISDEEIRSFYARVAGSVEEGADLPAFDELKPQIEQQLAQERSRELIENYIAELRTKADISVLI